MTTYNIVTIHGLSGSLPEPQIRIQKLNFFLTNREEKAYGAIQVLRNAIFLEIGPPPTPLVTLITLNITPS